MTTQQDAQEFIGRTAVDSEGGKVGKVGQVYVDERNGVPLWVTVATGMFGTRQSFAPVYGSQVRGDQVILAVSKELIKDAPNIDDDGHIDSREQDALYRHYADYLGAGQSGYSGGQAGYEPSGQASHPGGGVQGRDTSGPTTDNAMTRSEEQLRVGTETVESARARLRKYVVTENVSTTIPVSHEEVHVEREPITDANRDAALSGEPISDEEHEIILRAERPVVAKEAVPVERVRLTTETVTEDAAVNETVRKERIEEPDVDVNPRDAGH
jgi:uncharacterized protein (TIGR02271 family)